MDFTLDLLKKHWGYDQLRPVQSKVIQAILSGKDVLAIMSTGSGKSLCFQLPALLQPGISIVVTPLIALMQDQVTQLKSRGIAAEFLFSGISSSEIDRILDNCIYGQVKLLYVSPERLHTELFQARIQNMKIQRIVVDEAHCISQWGHDFRPAYRRLIDLRTLCPGTQVLALTATATPVVQQDIQTQLGMQLPVVLKQSFCRENLHYRVQYTEDHVRQLLRWLHQVPGTAIVYVATRRRTKHLANLLKQHKINALPYHAGLPLSERTFNQTAWVQGKTRVIVATSAFGMGIDKPDVRLVIHLDIPASLEAYYQEAGRVGRDGKESYAVMLYDNEDIHQLRDRVTNNHPTVSQLRDIYQDLVNHYQIAEGSPGGIVYTLDLDLFAQKYNWKLALASAGMNRLAESAVIKLQDGYMHTSKLHVTIDYRTLRQFQVMNTDYSEILKSLLRLYGGELFLDFCSISENRLANLIGNVTEPQIQHQLRKLHQLEIVRYNEKTSHQQFMFLGERQAVNQLQLNTEQIRLRLDTAKLQLKCIIDYIAESVICREQQLVSYFGENQSSACGRCDRCLNYTDRPIQRDDILSVWSQLKQRTCISEMMIHFPPHRDKEVLETVRWMIDSGELPVMR